MKKQIRLTENELHRLVESTIKKILKEEDSMPSDNYVKYVVYAMNFLKNNNFPNIEDYSIGYDENNRYYTMATSLTDDKRHIYIINQLSEMDPSRYKWVNVGNGMEYMKSCRDKYSYTVRIDNEYYYFITINDKNERMF